MWFIGAPVLLLMTAASWSARSRQIAAAAGVLVLAWAVTHVSASSLPTARAVGGAFAAIDAVLAIYFWEASRGRWFPAPLCLIHCMQSLSCAFAALFPENALWSVALAHHGLFGASVSYVVVAALYRRARLRAR